MLEVYPSRAQAALDAMVTAIGGKSICAAAGDGVADMAAVHAAEPDGYPFGTVITWAMIGIVIGAVAASTVALVTP